MVPYERFKQRLLALRQELSARVDAVETDLHHRIEPLEKDFEEQSLQLENEEVLSALDDNGLAVLAQVNQALQRMQEGTYGVCVVCGVVIPEARLEAVPYASLCVKCAEAKGD